MDIITFLAITCLALLAALYFITLYFTHKIKNKKDCLYSQMLSENLDEISSLQQKKHLAELEFERVDSELASYKTNQKLLIEQDLNFLKQQELDKITRETTEAITSQQQLLTTTVQHYQEQTMTKMELLAKDVETCEKELASLKSKRDIALNLVKEEEQIKDELIFFTLALSSLDIDDIKELSQVEKRINNKDVLRKLIYKTYIETPMNMLFGRVGIKDAPGIYKITNQLNQMVYIGQSTNVKNRVKAHIQAALGISTIASQLVHDKMAEIGLEHFTFQLIEECPRELLNEREKYWIEHFDSSNWGYNRTVGNK